MKYLSLVSFGDLAGLPEVPQVQVSTENNAPAFLAKNRSDTWTPVLHGVYRDITGVISLYTHGIRFRDPEDQRRLIAGTPLKTPGDLVSVKQYFIQIGDRIHISESYIQDPMVSVDDARISRATDIFEDIRVCRELYSSKQYIGIQVLELSVNKIRCVVTIDPEVFIASTRQRKKVQLTKVPSLRLYAQAASLRFEESVVATGDTDLYAKYKKISELLSGSEDLSEILAASAIRKFMEERSCAKVREFAFLLTSGPEIAAKIIAQADV